MAAAEPARSRRPPSDDEVPDREARTRTSARKTTARKAPARGAPGSPGAARPVDALRAAVKQLAELLGRVPDSVSSLRPSEDGWEARVEVVELERIPDTTSILASYKVTLNEDGDLISYERTRRYSRGMIDRPT